MRVFSEISRLRNWKEKETWQERKKKRGTRALFNAFNSLKGPVQNKAQMNFKDLGD